MLLLLCWTLSLQTAESVSALGQIKFETSGSPAAQEYFLRGTLLLHSFEYDDAAEAYRQAQSVDPALAMAYWGEALSYHHTLWREEDLGAARATLEKLAPSAEERRALAPTAKEKDWLAAVEILYGEGTALERRRAYAAAMQNMIARYPEDIEVAAFTSVALLGTVPEGRDVAVYMRAAAIAEEVYEQNPDHPGALHYAIHSYDDPVHAVLGLRMARRYDKVAPAAAHALHMPSHIYVALGLWKESARANENSVMAADTRVERKGLTLEERGWHAFWWLGYSYLQLGRIHEARGLLQEMVRAARSSDSVRTRSHLVRMRAEYLLTSERWNDAAAGWSVRLDGLPQTLVAADLYCRGLVAVSTGKLERAKAVLAELKTRRDEGVAEEDMSCCQPAVALAQTELPSTTPPYLWLAMEHALRGAILDAEGNFAAAREEFTRATAAEESRGFELGPPVVVKPTHELFGEVLLRNGEFAAAKDMFAAALRRAPRRSLSLRGLLQCCAALGDGQRAEDVRTELAAVWRHADGDYDLTEVLQGSDQLPEDAAPEMTDPKNEARAEVKVTSGGSP